MEKYINKVLKNGLKILFIPMEKAEIVHIELKILCGWEHENKETLECAHFLEHMLAKFTSKEFPDAKLNKYQLGKYGIYSNASTTPQITSYFLEGNIKHADYMLDLILHSYKDFLIDNSVFEQERKAIVQELHAIKEELQGDLFEIVDKIIYSKTDKEKVKIDDRIKNVKKLTQQDLLKFRKKYYSSRSTLLVIAGDINYEYFLPKIESLLENFTLLDFKPIEFPIIQLKKRKQRSYFIENKFKTNVTLIILFFNKYNYFDKEFLFIPHVHNVLTSGLSSRLNYKLRSELGLVYYIASEHNSNMDGVNYEIVQTEFDAKNMLTVLSIIFEEISKIKKEYIHDDELEKSLNTLINCTLRDNLIRTPDFVIDKVSTPLLFNLPDFTFQYKYDIMKNIDIKTIRKTARRIFSKKNMFIFYESSKNLDSSIKNLFPDCTVNTVKK
jgi:zinc protease